MLVFHPIHDRLCFGLYVGRTGNSGQEGVVAVHVHVIPVGTLRCVGTDLCIAGVVGAVGIFEGTNVKIDILEDGLTMMGHPYVVVAYRGDDNAPYLKVPAETVVDIVYLDSEDARKE